MGVGLALHEEVFPGGGVFFGGAHGEEEVGFVGVEDFWNGARGGKGIKGLQGVDFVEDAFAFAVPVGGDTEFG